MDISKLPVEIFGYIVVLCVEGCFQRLRISKFRGASVEGLSALVQLELICKAFRREMQTSPQRFEFMGLRLKYAEAKKTLHVLSILLSSRDNQKAKLRKISDFAIELMHYPKDSEEKIKYEVELVADPSHIEYSEAIRRLSPPLCFMVGLNAEGEFRMGLCVLVGYAVKRRADSELGIDVCSGLGLGLRFFKSWEPVFGMGVSIGAGMVGPGAHGGVLNLLSGAAFKPNLQLMRDPHTKRDVLYQFDMLSHVLSELANLSGMTRRSFLMQERLKLFNALSALRGKVEVVASPAEGLTVDTVRPRNA